MMKIKELINEISTYKGADRFPHFIEVDGIKESQLVIKGELKNRVYAWGIIEQGDEWIFFETDYDRGYIFYYQSFGSEEEVCDYAREHFTIYSKAFSAPSKSKYDIVIQYIQKEYGYSKDKAEDLLIELCKYEDIFEEFSNYIRVKKLRNKDRTQVIIKGISAEKLVLECKMSVLEAYITLINLRNAPKEIILLTLCKILMKKIEKCEGYEIVIEAIEKCWEWVESKNVAADTLYFYLENLDEKDIMTYMQIDKSEDNEPVWMCIANALAYIIRTAYQFEGQVYMPETIECVDDETIESFFVNLSKVFSDSSWVDIGLAYIQE